MIAVCNINLRAGERERVSRKSRINAGAVSRNRSSNRVGFAYTMYITRIVFLYVERRRFSTRERTRRSEPERSTNCIAVITAVQWEARNSCPWGAPPVPLHLGRRNVCWFDTVRDGYRLTLFVGFMKNKMKSIRSLSTALCTLPGFNQLVSKQYNIQNWICSDGMRNEAIFKCLPRVKLSPRFVSVDNVVNALQCSKSFLHGFKTTDRSVVHKRPFVSFADNLFS